MFHDRSASPHVRIVGAGAAGRRPLSETHASAYLPEERRRHA